MLRALASTCFWLGCHHSAELSLHGTAQLGRRQNDILAGRQFHTEIFTQTPFPPFPAFPPTVSAVSLLQLPRHLKVPLLFLRFPHDTIARASIL